MKRYLLSSSAALAALLSTNCWAQASQAAAEAAVNDSSEAIVVTGSRIVRDVFNAPTPVNVVGTERLEQTGIPNIGDALNQLPSFREVTSPATNLYRTSTNTAARTLDLRGLGDSRTLVLVDGRRFVPSSELGTVDLNAIPSSLVQRAEVVTGGASAAYGANAVAGVVNLILDTGYEGIKATASYGETEIGDAQTYEITGAFGTSFADGRGHFLFGGEYVDEKAAGDAFTRDWYDDWQYINNPFWNADPELSDGRARTLMLPGIVQIHTEGGVIRTGPLRGTQFHPETGLPIPFQFGELESGIVMSRADPYASRSFLTEGPPLRSPNRHISLLGHGSYEVSDGLELFLELSYANVRGGPTRGSDAFVFDHPISVENPFIPAETLQAALDAGITTFPLGKLFREIGPINGISENDTYRGVVGARGDISGDWSWDAYYQYGETNSRLDIENLRHTARFNQAVDAVRAPDGTIVCRSTLTDPGNGCVPFNVFGANRGSPEAVAYVTGDAWATRKITQHAAAVNFRGTLADGWAGPIKAAFGAEYRRDRSSGDADATSKASAWSSNSAYPLPPGGDNTIEGYAEVAIPLLDGSAIGDATLDGAIRQTHTRDTGHATTWKVGLVSRPIEDIMFRVTRSHDIRAPSELELSTIRNSLNLPINDGANGTYYPNLIQGGNPDLENEVADTFTAGLVLTPGFFPGFRLSVDYYDIKVEGAIAVLTGQQTVDACAAGVDTVCGFITRGSNGLITEVLSTYANLDELHSEGIEFVGEYTMDLGGGSLTFSANATHTLNLTTSSPTGLFTQYAGWTGNPGTVQSVFGVPRWKGDLLIAYSDDRLSLSTHARYVGPGVYDPTKIGPEQEGYSPSLPNSNNYNEVDSRLYWDLNAGFDIFPGPERKVEVFAAVYNLFDKDPPLQRLYGNPVLFDALGRRYRIGIRTEF